MRKCKRVLLLLCCVCLSVCMLSFICSVGSSAINGTLEFDDFNPDLVPWGTFPQYIQDIVYMSPSKTDDYNFNSPFVIVDFSGWVSAPAPLNIKTGTVRFWVGNGCSFIYNSSSKYLRIGSVSLNPNAVMYSAIYTCTEDQMSWTSTTNWHIVDPTSWGTFPSQQSNVFNWYSGSTYSGSSVNRDLYYYSPHSSRWSYNSWSFYKTNSDNTQNTSAGLYTSYNDSAFLRQVASSASPPPINITNNIHIVQLVPKPADYWQQVYNMYLEGKNIDEVVDKVDEAKTGIIGAILEGLQSVKDFFVNLFIPPDDFMDDFRSGLKSLCEDHLGILYQAPQLVINVFEGLLDYNPTHSEDFSDYYIEFPELKYPKLTANNTLEWETFFDGTIINFSFLNVENSPIRALYDIYRIFITCVLYFLLIRFAWKKFDQVMLH